MSISAQGGQERRPSAVNTGKKPAGGKPSVADGGIPTQATNQTRSDSRPQATSQTPPTSQPQATRQPRSDSPTKGGKQAPAGRGPSSRASAKPATGGQRKGATGSPGKGTTSGQGKTTAASQGKAGSGDKGGSRAKTAPAGRKTAAGPGRAGGGPRRPVPRVTARPGPGWGPIALVAAVVLVTVGILGYGGWTAHQGTRSWQERATGIEGLLNFRQKDPKMLEYDKHTQGPLTYRVNPAVGGTHNNDWQNCMGDVYDAPIAQEHAVHSLEHGAVWVTYRSDLPEDQVDQLAGKVRGKEKMLMSPYRGLDSPISLQAWGYQLKVPNANDGRIDEFIKTMRVNASIEGANASCAQGITATGDAPRNLPQQQQQQQQPQR